MPEADTAPDDMPAGASQTPRGRGAILALCVCGLLVLLGLGARAYLLRVASVPPDQRALPRPDANAPFITTPPIVVDKMIELAQVGPDDLLIDLGCGDGRIVVAAAKQRECRGIGYDLDPRRIKESRENARVNQVESLVTFEQKNIFDVDLGEADAVTMYLLPRLVVKLIPQLKKLRPGTRVISHDFWIDGLQASSEHIVIDEEGRQHTLYMYTTPLVPAPKKL
jgi:SAM-dependent methyltransferase